MTKNYAVLYPAIHFRILVVGPEEEVQRVILTRAIWTHSQGWLLKEDDFPGRINGNRFQTG